MDKEHHPQKTSKEKHLHGIIVYCLAVESYYDISFLCFIVLQNSGGQSNNSENILFINVKKGGCVFTVSSLHVTPLWCMYVCERTYISFKTIILTLKTHGQLTEITYSTINNHIPR